MGRVIPRYRYDVRKLGQGGYSVGYDGIDSARVEDGSGFVGDVGADFRSEFIGDEIVEAGIVEVREGADNGRPFNVPSKVRRQSSTSSGRFRFQPTNLRTLLRQ
jgi:hypothetical protein